MTVIFLPIEIYRRLNEQISAFYAQKIVHAVLSLETRPTTRKMRTFVVFVENDRYFLADWDISTCKRPNYYMLSADHCAHCSKHGNKPDNSQNATIHRFWRKMYVIALSFEIFRRINNQVTAFDAQNIVHDVLSLETSPTTRKMR
jgi:hypothetical protein